MSQPKQLKKLTRERMDATGESYTTARKAILAGKPANPGTAARGGGPGTVADSRPADGTAEEQELPEYPAPDNVTQYDAGLWHRVLTQAGVTNPITGSAPSEALLAGLAGGIGFMVFTFEYESVTTATVVTRSHPEPYTASLLARLGVPVRETHTSSVKQAQANLDGGLDEGRAVVVRVTEGALPWIASAELEDSESVDVAVVGEDDGDYLVDDGSGALRVITAEELAAARSKRKKDRHWQAWIPEPVAPRVKVLRRGVVEAVDQTTGRLLGTAPLQGIPAHFAKNFGVAGMRNWAERLRDTTTRRGWTALFADEERLRGGLGQLAGFLDSDRFCGAGGLRGLYADFLEESGALPGLGGLAAAAAPYRELAPLWEELAELVDPDVEAGERSALFARMADLVERIADAEESAARGLRAALEAATAA